MGDLLAIDRAGVDLRVILVDNASDVPLSTLRVVDPRSPEAGEVTPWFPLEHLRLTENTGGSGGYNAGMRRALEYAVDRAAGPWDPDYIWMVDSDARVAPDTLARLLRVMQADPSIAAAGSAIADPLSGQVFEIGGHINRRNGNYEPYVMGSVGVRGLVDADYVAACCALVRAAAVRATGVMPDRFLNGDDVEWFVRIGQVTGGRIVGVPDSVAMHPRFDRFPTWTRYYTTRNAFGPIACVDRGYKTRRIKAKREAIRAVQQSFMGRDDLSTLHVRALEDAGRGVVEGKAAPGVVNVLPMTPFAKLAPAIEEALAAEGLAAPTLRPRLRVRVMPDLLLTPSEERVLFEQLNAAGIKRWSRTRAYRRSLHLQLLGVLVRGLGLVRRPHVAVVPARGQAFNWFAAPILVQVTAGGAFVRRTPRLATAARAVRWWVRAHAAMYRAALKTPPPPRMYPGMMARPEEPDRSTLNDVAAARAAVTVDAVVLSHNRPDALAGTIAALARHPLFADHAPADPGNGRQQSPDRRGRVLVVHNASDAGPPDLTSLRTTHPSARVDLLTLDDNLGVEAFNRGVAECAGRGSADHLVLILDDDAIVEAGALAAAARLMGERPDLAAVTFHPRHPVTSSSEWPFHESLNGRTTDRWPVMGCANLVRSDVWARLGGYERAFFLYRNDADLALRILQATEGPNKVHFNPRWVVWHDTPVMPGSPKGERWHRFATRNWVWMCRRNAPRLSAARASTLGWLWAHRLAGLSARKHLETLKGAWEGLRSRPPMPEGSVPGGRALTDLIDLQLTHRRRKSALRKAIRS